MNIHTHSRPRCWGYVCSIIALITTSITLTIISVIIGFLSESWFLIWTILEFNNIAFCCILFFRNRYNQSKRENTIKYFIIQSTASAVLLVSNMFTIKYLLIFNVLLALVIITKRGMIPLHTWFVDIATKLNKIPCLLLITTQKILPVYIIRLTKLYKLITLLILSMALRRFMQYIRKNFTTILVYSSIFNIRWIFLASQVNNKTLIIILISYIIIILWIFNRQKKIISINENESNSQIKTMIMICRLAGIPPFMIFIPKWLLIKEMIKINLLFVTILSLILRSINFYIYIRIFTPILINKPMNQLSLTKKSNLVILLVSNILTMLFLVT